MNHLRIATRRSPLALWQAEHVAARLRVAHPDVHVELLPLVTEGDRRLDQPLSAFGGKGVFLKELEWALERGEADLAVHSLKDVPVRLPPGFELAAISSRAAAFDAWVSSHWDGVEDLPPGARVGTSSLRRQALLRALRPDLELLDLRGNVGSRLARLDRAELDGILLAQAGLDRLGLGARVRAVLQPPHWIPAPAQGFLAIEVRAGDELTTAAVACIHDPHAAPLALAERALSEALGGDCRIPLGAWARIDGAAIALSGLLGDPTHGELLRADAVGSDPQALGRQVAQALLAQGGERLLANLRGA